MALIEWQPRLSVGVTEFDDDHKKLIVLINALWEANQQRRASVLEGILDELAEYVSFHFRREEDLFQRWGFPGADRHHDCHQRLETQVADLRRRYQVEPVLANDVFEFLRDWLIKHILGDDMVYASYFRALGVTGIEARPGRAGGPEQGVASGGLWAALGIGGLGACVALGGAAGGLPALTEAAAAASVLAMAVLAWLILGQVVRPMAAFTRTLQQLSVRNWDLAGELRPTGMLAAPMFYAKVVGGLLQDLASKGSKGEEILKEGEKEIKQTLLSMSDQLEQEINGTVSEVTVRSDQLSHIARTMLEQATSVSERNRAVAQAAKSATDNVTSVASSATELLDSLREMEDETAQSRRIAEQAAVESRQTIAIVESLSEASQQIGTIVGMIDAIARQTNMLALNATIEAARAGEAGRGFAVVAGEVKGLAGQTTEATSQIRELVDTIQAAVSQAAEAIGRVDGVVERINAVSATMAGTIRRQAVSAGAISDGALLAANETRTVTSTIARISETATEAEQLSSIVMQTVGSVSSEVGNLRNNLVATLRGSFAGNRRRHRRFAVSSGAILSADGARLSGKVRDMSVSGALVEARSDRVGSGNLVRFVADGFGEDIPARVVKLSDAGCHLEFLAAEDLHARIGAWLDLIGEVEEPDEPEADLGSNVDLF